MPSDDQRGGRPEPSDRLDPGDIERWYWTRAELAVIARELGVSTTGNKGELAARVEAALAGKPIPAIDRRKRSRLEGRLTRGTVIPEGVILSRHLRDWFEAGVGPGFKANGHLRQFLAEGAGRTLGEAADHWVATRDRPAGEIGTQFELNRFTRLWWLENPRGTREELERAWRSYREAPAESRLMPGERS